MACQHNIQITLPGNTRPDYTANKHQPECCLSLICLLCCSAFDNTPSLSEAQGTILSGADVNCVLSVLLSCEHTDIKNSSVHYCCDTSKPELSKLRLSTITSLPCLLCLLVLCLRRLVHRLGLLQIWVEDATGKVFLLGPPVFEGR